MRRSLLFGEVTMWSNSTPLESLAEQLRKAAVADRELFANVLEVCTRIATLIKMGKASRLDQLLSNSAWTDAALLLIAMELPAFTVRRLVYEDGEWVCSLSQQPNLPLAVDDTVDTHHAALPLAVLGALIEARARKFSETPSSQRVPQVRSAPEYVHCCDNFV